MARAAGLVVGGLLLAGAACWMLFALAMRTKFRPVQNRIRRMNRALANPDALKTAGQRGAWASVVQHVGRTSGRRYRTPVVAAATSEGFVIGLAYGPRADWLQNVLTAGCAVIERGGDTHRVDRPELVAAAAASPYFPPMERRTHRLYRVDEFLLLRHTD